MGNIYGDYNAPAVSSTTTMSAWHIQGGDERTTLCGKVLRGDIRHMRLSVNFLECSLCMKRGGQIYDPNNKDYLWAK